MLSLSLWLMAATWISAVDGGDVGLFSGIMLVYVDCVGFLEWVMMGFAMGGFQWFGFAVGLGLGLPPWVMGTMGFFFFFFFCGVDGQGGWYSSDFQWWWLVGWFGGMGLW